VRTVLSGPAASFAAVWKLVASCAATALNRAGDCCESCCSLLSNWPGVEMLAIALSLTVVGFDHSEALATDPAFASGAAGGLPTSTATRPMFAAVST
jgi:hypothetical protein